jgi:fructokinase
VKGFSTIQHILDEKRLHTKLLYDVNLRPQCYSRKIVIESLKHTDILKLNDDELHTIKDMLGFKNNDEAFVEFLRKEFSIEMVALTKGEQGSEIYSKDQHTVYRSRKLNNIVDTVGAGDGFASILAVGYLLDWFPYKILSVASSFAEEICKVEGAILSDKRFYDQIKMMIEQPESVA